MPGKNFWPEAIFRAVKITKRHRVKYIIITVDERRSDGIYCLIFFIATRYICKTTAGEAGRGLFKESVKSLRKEQCI